MGNIFQALLSILLHANPTEDCKVTASFSYVCKHQVEVVCIQYGFDII